MEERKRLEQAMKGKDQAARVQKKGGEASSCAERYSSRSNSSTKSSCNDPSKVSERAKKQLPSVVVGTVTASKSASCKPGGSAANKKDEVERSDGRQLLAADLAERGRVGSSPTRMSEMPRRMDGREVGNVEPGSSRAGEHREEQKGGNREERAQSQSMGRRSVASPRRQQWEAGEAEDRNRSSYRQHHHHYGHRQQDNHNRHHQHHHHRHGSGVLGERPVNVMHHGQHHNLQATVGAQVGLLWHNGAWVAGPNAQLHQQQKHYQGQVRYGMNSHNEMKQLHQQYHHHQNQRNPSVYYAPLASAAYGYRQPGNIAAPTSAAAPLQWWQVRVIDHGHRQAYNYKGQR